MNTRYIIFSCRNKKKISGYQYSSYLELWFNGGLVKEEYLVYDNFLQFSMKTSVVGTH